MYDPSDRAYLCTMFQKCWAEDSDHREDSLKTGACGNKKVQLDVYSTADWSLKCHRVGDMKYISLVILCSGPCEPEDSPNKPKWTAKTVQSIMGHQGRERWGVAGRWPTLMLRSHRQTWHRSMAVSSQNLTSVITEYRILAPVITVMYFIGSRKSQS